VAGVWEKQRFLQKMDGTGHGVHRPMVVDA